MRNRLLVAAASASVLIGLVAPRAQADRLASPGDCAGIQTVSGGYRLTQDVTCDFNWAGTNDVLNLNNHTLTSMFLPQGSGQTIKNGTLLATSQEYLANATKFTISHLTIQPATTLPGFMIEAGTGLTVTHSVIKDAPIGLDFYFGGDGMVSDSTFSGASDIGLSIQQGSDVTVLNNTFTGNLIGVNLWNEDSYGVTDNTIEDNTFRANTEWGLYLDLQANVSHPDTGSGNTITRNSFTGSGGSGINAALTCGYLSSGNICPAGGNQITANTFKANGATASTSSPFADDGITARAVLYPDAQDSTSPYPAGLAGITITGNTANRNTDLGFDVTGVTDGGANQARHNGNPAQCQGVSCPTSPHLDPASPAAPHRQQTHLSPRELRH